MSDPFLGEIRIFPYDFAPRGWAQCNGQLLSISTNQALFSLLGTMYGGNGITNFALPNLQGRTPLHPGNGYVEGQQAGQSATTLTTQQMPQHTHFYSASSATADKTTAENNCLATLQSQQEYGNPTTPVSLTGVVAGTGQSIPYDNHQPYLVANFCIALQGIFPSRS